MYIHKYFFDWTYFRMRPPVNNYCLLSVVLTSIIVGVIFFKLSFLFHYAIAYISYTKYEITGKSFFFSLHDMHIFMNAWLSVKHTS